MSDYGDLSYLTEAKYEQQLVQLSQGAELVSLPIGTRGFIAGKVSSCTVSPTVTWPISSCCGQKVSWMETATTLCHDRLTCNACFLL